MVKDILSFVDDWVKCDDDKMSNVTTEDIIKLSGGGKTIEPFYN